MAGALQTLAEYMRAQQAAGRLDPSTAAAAAVCGMVEAAGSGSRSAPPGQAASALVQPALRPRQQEQQQPAAAAECPDYLGLMQQLQEREEELAVAQRGEWVGGVGGWEGPDRGARICCLPCRSGHVQCHCGEGLPVHR